MRVSRKHVFHVIFLTLFPAIFLGGAIDAASEEKGAGASVAGHISRFASGTPRPGSDFRLRQGTHAVRKRQIYFRYFRRAVGKASSRE